MQNCAEMERYLENEQPTTTSSERKTCRSWTTFLSSVEQRPSSLALRPPAVGDQSNAVAPTQQQQQQHLRLLPASFTLHRHCSTPSPTASSSPFSLASPSSLGATTPDDDGTNPVDILCSLNIDGVTSDVAQKGSRPTDVVSSSSSSTTSWDSSRSDPDVPIRRPPTQFMPGVRQRYVRRPTELPVTPVAAGHRTSAWPSPCRPVDPLPTRSALNINAACFRRIAKRRWRTTDDVAWTSVAAATSSQSTISLPRATPTSVASTRTRCPPSHVPPHPTPRLPPLPSPAEMAYLRSLSGGVGGRAVEVEAAKRGSTDSTGTRGVQRVVTSSDRGCPPPSRPLSPSTTPEHSRLAAAESSTTTDPASIDAKKQARIYGCTVVECGKLYSKSSHLKAHMRSHTGTATVY